MAAKVTYRTVQYHSVIYSIYLVCTPWSSSWFMNCIQADKSCRIFQQILQNRLSLTWDWPEVLSMAPIVLVKNNDCMTGVILLRVCDTVKKAFCCSFPPENSCIKDIKSRCIYQNNVPAAHRVFLNYPCQKSYDRKIPARNNRYGRKIPASGARKGKARKSQQGTTDTAGTFGCQ